MGDAADQSRDDDRVRAARARRSRLTRVRSARDTRRSAWSSPVASSRPGVRAMPSRGSGGRTRWSTAVRTSPAITPPEEPPDDRDLAAVNEQHDGACRRKTRAPGRIAVRRHPSPRSRGSSGGCQSRPAISAIVSSGAEWRRLGREQEKRSDELHHAGPIRPQGSAPSVVKM